MVSLWGSKSGRDDQEERPNGGEGEDHEQSRLNERHERHERHEDTNERTRLLSPPRGGYLDPDDPAVSPYNLWSVRAIRYLAVLFFFITFLWWVLLLVSLFVSPPGMHSRGSGFFDFSYTTITLGNLLVAVLFFSFPSKALEISSLLIAVILVVNMIMILAFPKLRAEEGWVGILSVVWASLMALFNAITDRVVAWGKREEEERLTGRHETRRSLREWCAILTYSVILTIIVVVTIFMTGTLGLRARDASLEAPGDLWYVDSGKYQVHLFCAGNTTDALGRTNPTILLEGGETPFENTFEKFIYGTYQNGTIPRYCYWDRPGIAFSDNAPSPHSAGMAAGALAEALAQAGEDGPFILVSAGIGSIYSRIFSSRNLGQVASMFLIDPLHEDFLWRVGAPGTGFLYWAWGIISPLGLRRLPAALFKGRTREERVYGDYAFEQGKFIKAKLQENLVANSLTKSEVSQARNIQTRDMPLVIVSSGIEYHKDNEWAQKQKDLTVITDKLLSWDVAKKAPHEVWRTFEGRELLEKRLADLIAAYWKTPLAGRPHTMN